MIHVIALAVIRILVSVKDLKVSIAKVTHVFQTISTTRNMQQKNIQNGEVKDGRLMVDPNAIELHDETLCRSAAYAISLLGESPKRAITLALKERGVSLDPDEFDIKEFEHVLEDRISRGVRSTHISPSLPES